MTLTQGLGLYNYWVVIVLMMTGFYVIISRTNLIKNVLGLNIFQTSVFLLYITMGKVKDATAPIIPPDLVVDHGGGDADHAAHLAGDFAVDQAQSMIYSNPLPSVLMLTAIVVGIATTALALALIVRIREQYGSIEEDEIIELDRRDG